MFIIPNSYYAGMSLGIVLVSAGVLYVVISWLINLTNSIKETKAYHVLLVIAKGQEFKEKDKKPLIYGLLGGGLLFSLTFSLMFFFVGMALGVVVYKVTISIKKDRQYNLKRKEIGIFFEAVEFYIKMGMSIPQSMYMAKMPVPHLEKSIVKCISLWPRSPQKALEVLRKDVDVPEAEILVSLLQRIEKSGIGNMEGIIQREARNIEKLREVSAKSQIAMRPVYFMVYRMLPLLASIAIFVGSLVYRLTLNFQSMGISF